ARAHRQRRRKAHPRRTARDRPRRDRPSRTRRADRRSEFHRRALGDARARRRLRLRDEREDHDRPDARRPLAHRGVGSDPQPLVAYLALRRDAKTIFFGVDDPDVGGIVPQAISDATRCPRCKQPLKYARVVLAHVGDWSCPSCGLTRPPRDVAATKVTLGSSGSELVLAGTVGDVFAPVRVPIPGLYNAYNALAALAAALAPSVEHAVITGIRGRDLALRFKYAGLAKERLEVVDDWSAAIERATTLAPEGGEVVVLATYTAMQALRAVLARAGATVPFWED